MTVTAARWLLAALLAAQPAAAGPQMRAAFSAPKTVAPAAGPIAAIAVPAQPSAQLDALTRALARPQTRAAGKTDDGALRLSFDGERPSAGAATPPEGRVSAPAALPPIASADEQPPVRPPPPKPPRPARKHPWMLRIVIAVAIVAALSFGAYRALAPRLRSTPAPTPIVRVHPDAFVLKPDPLAVMTTRPDAAQPSLAARLAAPAAPAKTAVLSPSGGFALTISADGHWRLWDMAARSAAAPSVARGRTIGATFLSERRLALLEADGTVRVWDRDGGSARTISVPAGAIQRQSFSSDGRRLVLASAGGQVQLLDLETAQASAFQAQGDVIGLGATPQGALMATRGGGQVKLWALSNSRPPRAVWEKTVIGASLIDAAIGSEGRAAAVAGSFAGSQGVVALKVGSTKLQILSAAALSLGPASLASIAVDASGARILVLASDGRLWIWSPESDDVVRIGAAEGGRRASFSPDGKQAVVVDDRGQALLFTLPAP